MGSRLTQPYTFLTSTSAMLNVKSYSTWITMTAPFCLSLRKEPQTREVLHLVKWLWLQVPHRSCFKPSAMLLKVTFMLCSVTYGICMMVHLVRARRGVHYMQTHLCGISALLYLQPLTLLPHSLPALVLHFVVVVPKT